MSTCDFTIGRIYLRPLPKFLAASNEACAANRATQSSPVKKKLKAPLLTFPPFVQFRRKYQSEEIFISIAELHSRPREHICISPIEVELTSSSRLNSLTAYLKKKTNYVLHPSKPWGTALLKTCWVECISRVLTQLCQRWCIRDCITALSWVHSTPCRLPSAKLQVWPK